MLLAPSSWTDEVWHDITRMRTLNSEQSRRQQTNRIIQDIGGLGIETLGPAYRIVLFNHLYQFRDR